MGTHSLKTQISQTDKQKRKRLQPLGKLSLQGKRKIWWQRDHGSYEKLYLSATFEHNKYISKTEQMPSLF